MFFFSILSFLQEIVVDTTSLTIPQLVHSVLLQNFCSNETNFQYFSNQSIGQFTIPMLVFCFRMNSY